jgi:hypothetical protein
MREFKKPNLKAPRYRPKIYNVLNPDLLTQFKEKYPKYDKLDYSTFKKIIRESSKKIWESVVEYRDGVELPEGLGYLFVGTCISNNSKTENINYGKSIKYGLKVTNNNLDSDGTLAKIFYTNYPVKYKVLDREIWVFLPCRNFKRYVSKTYADNWNRYIKMENKMKVSNLYTINFMKDLQQRADNEKIKDYNEFDID